MRFHLLTGLVAAVVVGCGGGDDAAKAGDSSREGLRTALLTDAAFIDSTAQTIEARINPSAGSMIEGNCGVAPGKGGLRAHIAGFHDSQELPLSKTSTDYGPQVLFYGCTVHRTATDFNNGTVVGFVQLRGPADNLEMYKNIGLNSKNAAWYCVWMKSGNPWQAAVTETTVVGCPTPAYGALTVQRGQIDGQTSGGYPEAVRIVDDEGSLPLLGVPCDDQWCEIGATVGAYQPPGHGPPANNAPENVKGWHDEQRVAYANSQGVLHRGERASIIPEPDIAKPAQGAYETPHPSGNGIIGMKVATVWFHGAPAADSKYADPWGIGSARTNLWLRRVTIQGTPILQAQFTPANIANPKGKWFYVKPTKHEGVDDIPSTARWLWDSADETIWLACEQGCCEVTMDGFSIVGKDTVRVPYTRKSSAR